MHKTLRGAGIYLIMLLLIVGIVRYTGNQKEKYTDMEFSTLYQTLKDGNIKDIKIVDDTSISGTLKDGTKFKSYIPSEIKSDKLAQDFLTSIEKDKVKLTAEPTPKTPWLIELLPTLLLLAFMVIAFFVIMNQSQGGGGKVMNFAKSKAKQHKSGKDKVLFKDVAGLKEEKEELQEIVDFLKNPKKYKALGARIPAGVLLEGPPGTGKTLLAKAVAGEAGVPFFSISGSDFVEMFVGVGASRVRSLFEDAKKAERAIIFIDEIDAVGRRRGAGMGGGNDEREQTLNQLLIEMDGFEGNENIIVIAATNRSDVLDPALLRPGRFDRKILVGSPDVKGREAILRVHAKNKPLAEDVNLKVVAQQTPGFVGADLENVLNEAALVAARRNKTKIDASDIDEAEDRVIAGPSKKDRTISQREREMVAYHEAGHTIVGLVLSSARVVHKVTIVPRGRAGGYMIALPKEDQMLHSKSDLKEQLAGLMGGRVAEEIIFNAQTTGASNDFEQATQLARAMVTEYGMSEKLGPVQYEGNHAIMAGQVSPEKSYSPQTAQMIDDEVRALLNEARNKAADIINNNRETHKLIAEALLKYETLDAAQIKSIYETGKVPEELENDTEEAHALSYDEVKEKMDDSEE